MGRSRKPFPHNGVIYSLIHHNRPTVYSKTMRCVFCNTATGGQAPVVGFCNTPTGGLKVRLKRGLCQATQVSCLQELT